MSAYKPAHSQWHYQEGPIPQSWGISQSLRLAMHELATAYAVACSEHGEDSERALFVADALEYMKRWMCRYATLVRGATLEEARD
jgi:hypothetical protein